MSIESDTDTEAMFSSKFVESQTRSSTQNQQAELSRAECFVWPAVCVLQLASRCVVWRECVDDFHLFKVLHIVYFLHFHMELFLQI